MTGELDALDREWFGLTDTGNTAHWQYTRDPLACFGLGGPWEWLVANTKGVSTGAYFDDDGYWASTFSGSSELLTESESGGATIYEAITRCAIEARKKVEGKS